MTLTELIQQIRMTTPIPNTNTTDAVLTTMINQMYQEVATAQRWPWLESTTTISVTDGTQNYNLPADFQFCIVLFETGDDRKALQQVSENWYWTNFSDEDAETDAAVMYFIYDDDLWLYPIPSVTTADKYTLKYYSTYTELSAGGDSPAFPAAFHYGLVHGVRSMLLQGTDPNAARASYSMFLNTVDEMRKYYNRVDSQNPMIYGDGIRKRWWTDPNLPLLDGV